MLWFFLLCKAGRCPRVSACTPCSCSWLWLPAGSGGAGRQVTVVTPVVVSPPGTPWHSLTTTSAPSTTGKAWGIGRGPLPQSSSVKGPGNARSLSRPVLLRPCRAVLGHWVAEAPLHRHCAGRSPGPGWPWEGAGHDRRGGSMKGGTEPPSPPADTVVAVQSAQGDPSSGFWEQSCWQGWALHLQSSLGARAEQGYQKPPSLPGPGSPAVTAAPVNSPALLQTKQGEWGH